MLNASERQRYERQLIMPEISESGQTKIRNASIFIAGIGGLGSISAYYMTAMGVGRIRLVDRDRVELSNLNRQIMHRTSDIGKWKTRSAEEKFILDLDPSLMNRLLRIDSWNMSFKTTHLTRNEDCNVCSNARSCHVSGN